MANDSIVRNRYERATTQDIAKLLLRLVLGVLILLHGISKIESGVGEILDVVGKAGMPHAFGYLVYIGEVVAPILVIIGLWTRPAALVIAIDLVVAVLLVHVAEFFTLNEQGGWALELQGLYLIVAICVALLGAGRYSLGGRFGHWN